jgi:hypothetical protein
MGRTSRCSGNKKIRVDFMPTGHCLLDTRSILRDQLALDLKDAAHRRARPRADQIGGAILRMILAASEGIVEL